MGCFGFLKAIMIFFNGIIFVSKDFHFIRYLSSIKSAECSFQFAPPQLAGVAILGVGIWVKVDSGSIFSFLAKIDNAPPELSQVLNIGYLLIALGALLVVIGFLGCCGVIKESRCMLLLVGC